MRYEAVYRTDLPREILRFVDQRMCEMTGSQPHAFEQPPLLDHPLTAVEVHDALVGLLRYLRQKLGDSFQCSLDLRHEVREYSAQELGDIVIDIAMRTHRAVGDEHASLRIDELVSVSCFQTHVVLVASGLIASLLRRPPLDEVLGAFSCDHRSEAAQEEASKDADEARDRSAGSRISFERLGKLDELRVGSPLQVRRLLAFIEQSQVSLAFVISVIAFLSAKVDAKGGELSDEEFQAALSEFRMRTVLSARGPIAKA